MLPLSIKEGRLRIGKWSALAHVLDNGMRVISSVDSLEIMGITAPKEVSSSIEKLCAHPMLKASPFVDAARAFSTPVRYKKGGYLLEGTDADSIIALCRLFIAARRFVPLNKVESQIASTAESFLISIAHVGLVALIDEATGYQSSRPANELQQLLDKYLRRELAIWAKRFPDEFYQQLFRLKGWDWPGIGSGKPGIVGTYTRDIVYARLAPAIVHELERLNPSDGHGHRASKHHQWLTDDIGHPALQQHIYAVLILMRASQNWDQFLQLLRKSLPRKGDQFDLFDPDLD